MKAMIAMIALVMAGQVWASSFDSFDQTPNGNKEIRNLIVKLKSDVGVQSLGFNRASIEKSPIISDLNIHLFQLNPMMNVEQVLNKLRQHPQVVYAQLDHPVTSRVAEVQSEMTPGPVQETGPNDPEFSSQWSLGLDNNTFGIDALNAWMTYGTGGKDADNNDLVVAVVDGGIEVSHPDLVDNIWTNQQEIVGNGIDDDGNGYVDDINGWNGYTNSGQQKSSSHGTHVAGIVGAKGNNQNQVTGVNWDVKIMNVPGSSGNTSIVLNAYKYILEQKKLWIETNGAKGANIVSTNSSFGIDFADCTSGSYPAWNDIYNEMGKVGILSAAATANRSVNIDQVGDVPTGCSSPYLITVTNTRRSGERASAGFGATTIDLAAPGSSILSTYSGGGTASLTGTSMSTPHVAGAVAFLQSISSKTLSDLYKNDPATAALEMKAIIMETVTERPALKTETISGGILNLNAAAAMAASYGMGN